MDEIQQIAAMIGDVGIWVAFLYLFIDERKRHQATREAYRDDLRSAAGFGALLRHPAAQIDTQPATDPS